MENSPCLIVDTNTIIESHRTGAWQALSGGYRVETVEDCVTETQTGFQLRRPEQSIVASELRASLFRPSIMLATGNALNWRFGYRASRWTRGEEALWAHALTGCVKTPSVF